MAIVIAIGTASELKIRAVREGLEGVFPEGYELRSGETESGVSKQPFGFEEIFRGAEARARASLKRHEADLGIGIESGAVEQGGCFYDLPVAFIASAEWPNMIGRGIGPGLPVPSRMIEEVRKNHSELGVIVQQLSGGGEKDPHAFLSKGFVDRESAIAAAVRHALCPIVNPHAYHIHNPNE